jgi:hypothetical protein
MTTIAFRSSLLIIALAGLLTACSDSDDPVEYQHTEWAAAYEEIATVPASTVWRAPRRWRWAPGRSKSIWIWCRSPGVRPS